VNFGAAIEAGLFIAHASLIAGGDVAQTMTAFRGDQMVALVQSRPIYEQSEEDQALAWIEMFMLLPLMRADGATFVSDTWVRVLPASEVPSYDTRPEHDPEASDCLICFAIDAQQDFVFIMQPYHRGDDGAVIFEEPVQDRMPYRHRALRLMGRALEWSVDPAKADVLDGVYGGWEAHVKRLMEMEFVPVIL
jgi:hypothetical protein